MLARLWWKEFRVFYPVWLALLLAAGLLQVLFVTIYREDKNHGILVVATLCWAGLYAFASGAAAFAGERESKTLGFLDALPVSRWTLWWAKVSFTLASTLGLALLLAGLAALGIEGGGSREQYGYRDYWLFVPATATLLFEAAAWSLLWSSLSKNPLMAGVFGVLSVYGSAVLASFLPQLDERLAGSGDVFGPGTEPARVVVAAVALALSCWVMVRKPGAAWSTRERELPVDSAPVPIRASSRWRSLAWLAVREGWANWLLLALVGLVLPIGLVPTGTRDDGPLSFVLMSLAGLVVGVGVFGTEDASGPRRFLVHHGLSAGAVWWRKLLPSVVVLAGAFALSSWIGSQTLLPEWLRPTSGPLGRERAWLIGLGLADSVAVGLLAGMAIRRRITAGLVGVIALVGLLPLQVTLTVAEVIPAWSVLLAPAILVGVSRGWAGDWLMEREGPRPWLRLGAWLVVPAILLFGALVAYRAFGVPDVGPQYVAASLQAPAPPADQDAAILYRRAAQSIAGAAEIYGDGNPNAFRPIHLVIENRWDKMSAGVVAYWGKNRAAIDLARRASALPRGRFEDVSRLSYQDESTYRTGVDLRRVQQLLALDVLEKLSRGDLPGAWAVILAEFRMANQLANDSPTIAQMTTALYVHHEAVGLAFAWLGAAKQDDASIRKALDDLKVLPPLPDLVATIQVESSLIERALGLPGEDLAVILRGGPDTRKISAQELFFYSRVVAVPWERQRARRVCRLRVSEELPEAALEPFQRRKGTGLAYLGQAEYFLGSKLLAGPLLPYFQATVDRLDREQVGRRALLQAVAVEAWERSHEGKAPEKLADLVPGLLDRLPIDPYSGRDFGYRISGGRSVLSPLAYEGSSAFQPSRPGQPLIYSVGADLRDDGGMPSFVIRQTQDGDLVYAVP